MCISFQGVEQAFYVWLNGKFVGYGEDSFTPSDFDLTPLIRKTGNRLCVEVYKRSSAAWLEDQDFFRFSGIFRSVYLYAKPRYHVEDVWVRAGLGEDYRTGTFALGIRVSAGMDGGSALKTRWVRSLDGSGVMAEWRLCGQDGDSQNGVKDLSGNPVVVEAMEMFSKFASYKDAGDTAVDQTQGIQNFAAGQRPMYMNGGWLMGDVIAAAPDGDFGMFPTPWSDDPEQNKLWIGIDDVFIVSQQTEHKDEVMTLLNFFAGEECSKTWMGTAKLMTSNITVPTDDADAFIKEIKTYFDNDMIVSKSLVPDYTSEYSTAFRTKVQRYLQR